MITDQDKALGVCRNLTSEKILSITPASRGGNSRLYRIETPSAFYAVKAYPPAGDDPRDRARTEFATLSFLDKHGINSAPAVIAEDLDAGTILMEWIDGDIISPAPTSNDIKSAVEFLTALHGLRDQPDAKDIGPASEACLSGMEIERQIRSRYAPLSVHEDENSALKEFLNNYFVPACEDLIDQVKKGYAAEGLNFETELPIKNRTLIPADFGFHNAMRTKEGRVVFIDFEYFGWDDPVKLAADFLLHPSGGVAPDQIDELRNHLTRIYGSDQTFPARLDLLYPLLALRWTLILLNEFLPERWVNRQHAGETISWDQVKQRQLKKAKEFMATHLGKNHNV